MGHYFDERIRVAEQARGDFDIMSSRVVNPMATSIEVRSRYAEAHVFAVGEIPPSEGFALVQEIVARAENIWG